MSPWLIAGNASEGSVISYHSSLKLLGHANSEINEMQIVVGLEYNRVPHSFSYQNSLGSIVQSC